MPDPNRGEEEKFRSLVEAYVSWYYAVYPTRATMDGVHDRDGELGHFSRADVGGYTASLFRYLGRLSEIDRERLGLEDLCDAQVLEAHLRSGLLELGRVRSWERNPLFYRELIAEGLYGLGAFGFAPPERRMVLAAERLGAVPGLLAEARETLNEPPRLYVEQALLEFPGLVEFLKRRLPAGFSEVKGAALRQRFDQAERAALESIEGFVLWLRDDLSKKAVVGFALGPEVLQAKLEQEEMVATPLGELLRRGEELLRRTQESMAKLAADPRAESFSREKASAFHLGADHVLEEARSILRRQRGWAVSLVGLPSMAECGVRESPEFRRARALVSLDCPGPFETVAEEAYLCVTLPDASAGVQEKDEHLARLNRYRISLRVAGEVDPGGGTLALAARRSTSKIRKVFQSRALREGWGRYCEGLYAEVGPEPSAPLRAEQLSLALLCLCRYIVGIRLHAGGMTVAEAVDFFVAEGFQDRAQAEREARRGALDPGILSAALGQMEIESLRDDYLLRGHSLRSFHTELLRHGTPPVAVLRRILLGGSS
jgi:hypothetical protein